MIEPQTALNKLAETAGIMKTIRVLLLWIGVLVLANCHNDEPTAVADKKIPQDSLYFSCRINGTLVEMKSPESTFYSWGNSTQRLNKVNGPKDSTIISYTREFHNDSLFITICYSRTILADTAINFASADQEIKNQIYATGPYVVQYLPPGANIKELPIQNQGFSITIWNHNNGMRYVSYCDLNVNRSPALYSEFEKISSCTILRSIALSSGVYADYNGARFVESTFALPLFSTTYLGAPTISLTEGQLIAVF